MSPVVRRPRSQSAGVPPPELVDLAGVIQVVILDPQAHYASALASLLQEEGFSPAILADSAALLQRTIDGPLDLIIMDLKLGSENGLDLLRRIRSVSNIPCVVLSATPSELDRVLALEMGADHFLSKSLTHREVLGPDGVPCGLTSAEFDILQLLAAKTGKAVSRDDISQQVFGRSHRLGDRTVDMLITRLRRKIERDAYNPRMIKSVRSVGYSFSGFLGDTE